VICVLRCDLSDTASVLHFFVSVALFGKGSGAWIEIYVADDGN
jgi:hypothetical protein